MADKWQAQYNFWSSFGIPAYNENSVPDFKDATFPYITYQAVIAGFDEYAVASASIWSISDSWEEADLIANAIDARLCNGGEIIPYSDGILWITPNVPIAQSMDDPNDDRIKRKLISVNVQFS